MMLIKFINSKSHYYWIFFDGAWRQAEPIEHEDISFLIGTSENENMNDVLSPYGPRRVFRVFRNSSHHLGGPIWCLA